MPCLYRSTRMLIDMASITQYGTDLWRRSFVPIPETPRTDELGLPRQLLIATVEVRHCALVGDKFYPGVVVLEVILCKGNTISVDMMPTTFNRRPGPQHHVGQSASNSGAYSTVHSAPSRSANHGAVVSIKLRRRSKSGGLLHPGSCPCGGDFQDRADKRAFSWECGRRQ